MAENPSTGSGDNFRAGYVAIVGAPNVGKSTLMNALVGQKISIVTDKPQTTRHRILGILSEKEGQAIFLDTPGLLEPKYELHRAMMSAVRSAVAESDILLLMVDATSQRADADTDERIMHLLQKRSKPVFLVINKIDRVTKRLVADSIVQWTKDVEFAEVFPISALNKTGTDELRSAIFAHLPKHPPYYPLDIVSEHPGRFFVGEMIREQIFELFRDEIPFSTTVEIIEFREQASRKDVVSAEIYVEKDSQKGILIGKGGTALKKVGEQARKEIEHFLGRKVFLQLHVKVREKWREDPLWVKRLGYSDR